MPDTSHERPARSSRPPRVPVSPAALPTSSRPCPASDAREPANTRDDGRGWLATGALFALLAVAAGAFAAHALRARLTPDLLAVFETAARYQMYHALALVACGLAAPRLRPRLLDWAGWLFVAGILLFSGSLYLLVLTGVRSLGAITPFGGTAWLVGWLLLALACRRQTAQ